MRISVIYFLFISFFYSIFLNAQDFIEIKSSKNIIAVNIINANETFLVYKQNGSPFSIAFDSLQSYYIDDSEFQNKLVNLYPKMGSFFNDNLPDNYKKAKTGSNTSYAFSISDTITFSSSFWTGDKISFQGKKNLRTTDIEKYLLSNPEAKVFLEKAKTNKTFSFIFSFGGGFAVGFAAGSAIGGKELNVPLIGAGVAGIALSIPFYNGYMKNMKKAVMAYNKSLIK
jgi:hypothetical protein